MTMAEAKRANSVKEAMIKTEGYVITLDGMRDALINEFGVECFVSDDYNEQLTEVLELYTEGLLQSCEDGLILWGEC